MMISPALPTVHYFTSMNLEWKLELGASLVALIFSLMLDFCVLSKTKKNLFSFSLFLFLLSLTCSFLNCLFCFRAQNRYNQAKLSIHDRTLKVAAVVESLEREMELLCLTGVEDQLQADVRPTLELLRNAGIKVSEEMKHLNRFSAANFWETNINPKGCNRIHKKQENVNLLLEINCVYAPIKPDCIKETRHFKSVELHLVLVPHLRSTSVFYLFFCSDLDADGGQAWDGYMHCQKLPFGLQKPRHPRLQTGMLFLTCSLSRCFDVIIMSHDTKHSYPHG